MSSIRSRRVAKAGGALGKLVGGVAVLVGAYLGLFSISAGVYRPPKIAQRNSPGSSFQGAFHVHSTLSDGRSSPEQIASAAREAGLQFVILTDHNQENLAAPRYQDGVLLITGVELSTPVGHLIAVGLPRGLDREERGADPIRRVHELGGFSFLAHPVQTHHPWRDWTAAARADGMELYSGDTMWREALRRPFTRLARGIGAYLADPLIGLLTFVHGQPEAEQRLLQLSADSAKVALCAHDAHGLPPYQAEFRVFSMHTPEHAELRGVLPATARAAASMLIDDLVKGRMYCGFDGLGDASGFEMEGVEGGAREAEIGSRLHLRLPKGAPSEARVQVWGSGRLEADGRTVVLDRPGPVQIEVWLPGLGGLLGTDWKPWIVPSPVWVRSR